MKIAVLSRNPRLYSTRRLGAQPSVSLKALCGEPFILTKAGSSELVSRLFVGAGLQPDVRISLAAANPRATSTINTISQNRRRM